MQTLDLDGIIKTNNLDISELATQLFPTNAHPKPALKRVLRGEALLNSEQIAKLAFILNTSVGALYSGNWTMQTKDGIFVFSNSQFTATLDPDTFLTRVFLNGSLQCTEIINSTSITLSEFLHKLDSLTSLNSI